MYPIEVNLFDLITLYFIQLVGFICAIAIISALGFFALRHLWQVCVKMISAEE